MDIIKLILNMNYFEDLERITLGNDNFRTVISTAPHSQLVLMSLLPGEDIGEEVHQLDQFIRVEKGSGKAILNGEQFTLHDGSAIVVPQGARHNIINTSANEKMKLYTVYSPSQHPDGTIHKTKADAMADENDRPH